MIRKNKEKSTHLSNAARYKKSSKDSPHLSHAHSNSKAAAQQVLTMFIVIDGDESVMDENSSDEEEGVGAGAGAGDEVIEL